MLAQDQEQPLQSQAELQIYGRRLDGKPSTHGRLVETRTISDWLHISGFR
jgi:hypothetical protein